MILNGPSLPLQEALPLYRCHSCHRHHRPRVCLLPAVVLLVGLLGAAAPSAWAQADAGKDTTDATTSSPRDSGRQGQGDRRRTEPLGDYTKVEYQRQESPRWWMLEFRFGPYKPNVDAESGLSGSPYKDIFECAPGKSCKSTWPGASVLSGLELDLHLWKGHGTLGIAASFGYFRIAGNSLTLEDPEQPYNPDTNPYVESDDETVFNLMPFVFQAVYRWDYAARHWGIPLVPYVKAGVVYALWWIEGPDGDTAKFSASGGKARGGTFGYQINLGLALELDFLEPSAAKGMDNELGINHTYLFCEFVHSAVRWASDDRMWVGMPATFSAGLALEF